MMSTLTVACVYVRGEYPYTVEYVRRLRDMTARWLDRPFRFVCLTDQPAEMPADVEAIPIRTPDGCSAPWAKLELFNPARAWTGRVLYLDLDVLVVAPLAPIVDFPSAFAITADPVGRQGRDAFGRRIVRRFNSSVMVWNGGVHRDLYTAWEPSVAQQLSGDQDWIGTRRPQADTMARAWFPRLSELTGRPSDPAKVVLCKVPKNHLAVERYPWVAPLWGAA